MAGGRRIGTGLAAVAICWAVIASGSPAQADSTVIDGPGFKVQQKDGWFGRKSTTYQDALGNQVEKKTGWFGRKSSKTKLFGSEAVTNGKNVTVTGPSGEPLITRKKTLFRGQETRVDGNGIFQSIKNMF